MAEVFSISDDNFDEKVGKGVTLVDFYADWCGPCKALTPILEELASELEDGDIKICKLDIDKNQNTLSKYQVTSVPTLIIFKDGQEKQKWVGVKDKETIRDYLESAKS